MRDALKMILEGFEEPQKAWDQIVPIVIVCGLLLAFMAWYAVPVPTELPTRETPRIDQATREALR